MGSRLRLYELLGLLPGADLLAIRRAFKRLGVSLETSRATAPPDALDRARELREAYDVLADPERREEYDEFGELALQPGFDARALRARREREKEAERRREKAALIAPTATPIGAPGQPRDWSIKVAIGLGTAKQGRLIRIPVARPVECPRCAGSGRRERTCKSCGGAKRMTWLRGESCAACHGVGVFAQERVRCRKCKGHGRRGRSLCAKCGGCGQEVKLGGCQVCDGRGLRIVRVEEDCQPCTATGLMPCQRCAGAKTISKRLSLKLRVPRHADEAAVYRYAGAGLSADAAGPGDLCVQFTVVPRARQR